MAVIYGTPTHGHDGATLIWVVKASRAVAMEASSVGARPLQPVLTLTVALRVATPHRGQGAGSPPGLLDGL